MLYIVLCSVDIISNICGTNRECLWKTSSYSHYMGRGWGWERGVKSGSHLQRGGWFSDLIPLSPPSHSIYGRPASREPLSFFAFTVHHSDMQVGRTHWSKLAFHFVLSVRVVKILVYAPASRVRLNEQQLGTCIQFRMYDCRYSLQSKHIQFKLTINLGTYM